MPRVMVVPLKGVDTAAIGKLPIMFAAPVRSRAPVRGVHVVRKGDTLSSIAARYKVSVADLKRWNHGSKLLAGQRLIVNAAAVQSKTSATPTARSSRPAAPANKTATKKPAVKPNSNRAAAKAPPARPAPASPAHVAGRDSSS